MKERVIILAEGGACGHFICTLLQSMHDTSFYDGIKMPNHGSMDLIAAAGSLTHKFLIDEKRFSIYPERTEAMDVLMNAFNNPESTYKQYQDEYEKQFHEVHVIHYKWIDHINRFLTLPNTKIIFVKYTQEDCKRIAVNKITKNFAIDSMATDSFSMAQIQKHYCDLLRWAGFEDAVNELMSLSHPSEISKPLMQTAITTWEKYVSERNIHETPAVQDNLIILNFDDLYFNKEVIMNSLSEFAGLPISDKTRFVYDDYLSQQPNIDLY